MRRVLAAFAALMILITLSCVPAAAEAGQLSLAYVPPSERGTIFYLDVSYDGSLSAMMLELTFDNKLAEYRDVEAIAATTTVKAKADGGKLTVVVGDSDRISGRLFRLTFKAVGSGNITFILRMTEGVDGDLHYVDLPPACTLSASLSTGSSSGSDSASSGSGSASSGSRSGKSYSGTGSTKGKSNASGTVDADTDAATGDETPKRSVRDLRTADAGNKTLIILGAAIGTAAALLVIFGFIIGRRSRKKKTPAEETGGEENEL